jgi:acetylglutamate kinase
MQPSRSQPIVIKIGGAVLEGPEGLATFWQHVRHLHETTPVVIVHGGGKQATDLAHRLGHQPRIVHGRRVTGDLDLDIVTWTLRGSVNAGLVAQAVYHGLPAVGLCGADGGLLRVRKRPPWEIDGETVDFGWVGDVARVEPTLLERLLEAGFVPVVAPLGFDDGGRLYNVNADTVARALATALHAAQLFLVTESGGVRRAADDAASHLTKCTRQTYDAGLAAGWINGGMGVKLHIAFEALHAGIAEVFILAPDDLLARASATRVVL